MASTARTPNHDEGLSARSTITGQQEYLLSTNGALNISGGSGGGGTITGPLGSTTAAASVSTVLSNDFASTAKVEVTDGTNLTNVLKSDGTAAGQNSLISSSAYLPVPINTTVTNTAVGTTDAGNYASVSFQLVSLSSGSVTFQCSDDNTTWSTMTMYAANAANTTSIVATTSSTNAYSANLAHRYFRVNVTGTSVAIVGTIVFSAFPANPPGITGVVGAAQNGTWTVGANSATGVAVPANAFYLAGNNGTNLTGITTTGAFADASSIPGSLITSQYVYNGTNFDRQRSASAASNTTGTGLLGAGILGFDGTNYQRIGVGAEKGLYTSNQASALGGWSFTNISTSTTTTVKSGAGTLHLVAVNTLGTVASTVTIYDNTAGSGTIIAIINSLTLSGSFTYDIAFSTGLTVVTTGTAAPNVTVAWK